MHRKQVSLERAVFAPLERLAKALHPYRWHFVLVALAGSAAFFALAWAGEQYWPDRTSGVLFYAAPVLANVVAWAWAARFLVSWYGPHRRPRFLRRIPPELLDPFAPIKRVWHLVVLLALLFSPCLVWLMWFKVR